MSLLITPINDDFVVSAQILAGDVKTIVELGYCTIINNRPDHEEEGQPLNVDIEASARKLSIPYHFIPVVSGLIREDQVAQLDTVLKTASSPVFAFCRSGSRCSKLYEMVMHRRASKIDSA